MMQSTWFIMLLINYGGEILIPKIPSIKILDLVEVVYGKNYHITGLRSGEKIHESLITTSESYNSYENKEYYLIGGSVKLDKIKKNLRRLKINSHILQIKTFF